MQNRKSRSALSLLATLIALSSCGESSVELSPGSTSIAWRYISDVPRSGARATLHGFEFRSIADGALVLETIKGSKPKSIAFRLVRFSANGSVESRVLLSKRPGFATGFIAGVNSAAKRVDVAIYEYRESEEGGSRTTLLSVSLATKKIDQVMGEDVLGYPKAAFRSDDGLTVFAGDDFSRLWLAAIDRNGKRMWRHFYDDQQAKALVERPKVEKSVKALNFFQGRFLKDNAFVLYSSGPEFKRDGVTHMAYELHIDASGKSRRWRSLFHLPNNELSRPMAWVGRVRAQVMGMRRHPEGGVVVMLRGWMRGEYARMRVARVGHDGRMKWVTTLVPGKTGEVVDIAVGADGEIVAVGSLGPDSKQALFRLGGDGKVVARYAITGMVIRHLRAHAAGGYVLSAMTSDESGRDRLNLMRIKAWPKN